MRKSVFAVALAAVVLLSGCSGGSQENGTSTPAEISKSELTNSASSTGSDKDQEKFDTKCRKVIEQLSAIPDTASYSTQFSESSVQYENDEICLSKLYTMKASGGGEDDRFLVGFLDIYSEDEYKYFQSAKNFINFVDENALEISGRNQFIIAINLEESGVCDINIVASPEGGVIIYKDRNIRSAYSDRLKSMDLLMDFAEQLTISGLIKYDDVSKISVPYDVSCEYQGKELTHQWYKIEDGKDRNVFVTYIDDGTYNNISDEELIYYAYKSVFAPNNSGATNYLNEGHYFAYKSSNDIACSIRYYEYSGKMIGFYCTWSGEYEYLNSNPLNENLNAILNEQEYKIE